MSYSQQFVEGEERDTSPKRRLSSHSLNVEQQAKFQKLHNLGDIVLEPTEQAGTGPHAAGGVKDTEALNMALAELDSMGLATDTSSPKLGDLVCSALATASLALESQSGLSGDGLASMQQVVNLLGEAFQHHSSTLEAASAPGTVALTASIVHMIKGVKTGEAFKGEHADATPVPVAAAEEAAAAAAAMRGGKYMLRSGSGSGKAGNRNFPGGQSADHAGVTATGNAVHKEGKDKARMGAVVAGAGAAGPATDGEGVEETKSDSQTGSALLSGASGETQHILPPSTGGGGSSRGRANSSPAASDLYEGMSAGSGPVSSMVSRNQSFSSDRK